MPARLFLAIRPPAEVVAELDRLVDPRRDADASLHWAAPEHWHLTLAFLGAVDEDHCDRLEGYVDAVAAATAPFELEVRGAGAFPHPDAARALWLGVGDGATELTHLAARCRTAASRSGIRADGRSFQPHLTLARSSRGVQARRWLSVIDTFGPFRWRVTDLLLIDSELTAGGPRHRVRRGFELAGDERMPA